MNKRSSKTTAVASGVRAACAANSAGKVAGVASPGSATSCACECASECAKEWPVSFQSPQDGVALGHVQDRQRPQRPVRIGNHPLQQPNSRAPSASTVVRSNRSLAYSSTPSIPAGAPSAARRSTSPTERSNFALATATGCAEPAAPAVPTRRRLAGLERQHHLEQRVPRQRPRRIEHLDQTLERQIRMAIGAGSSPAPARSVPGTPGCPRCRCAAPAC